MKKLLTIEQNAAMWYTLLSYGFKASLNDACTRLTVAFDVSVTMEQAFDDLSEVLGDGFELSEYIAGLWIVNPYPIMVEVED